MGAGLDRGTFVSDGSDPTLTGRPARREGSTPDAQGRPALEPTPGIRRSPMHDGPPGGRSTMDERSLTGATGAVGLERPRPSGGCQPRPVARRSLRSWWPCSARCRRGWPRRALAIRRPSRRSAWATRTNQYRSVGRVQSRVPTLTDAWIETSASCAKPGRASRPSLPETCCSGSTSARAPGTSRIGSASSWRTGPGPRGTRSGHSTARCIPQMRRRRTFPRLMPRPPRSTETRSPRPQPLVKQTPTRWSRPPSEGVAFDASSAAAAQLRSLVLSAVTERRSVPPLAGEHPLEIASRATLSRKDHRAIGLVSVCAADPSRHGIVFERRAVSLNCVPRIEADAISSTMPARDEETGGHSIPSGSRRSAASTCP